MHQVRGSGPAQRFSPGLRSEVLWLCIILGAGLLPRLIFIRAFPTHPISDFASLLDFSILFRDDWLAKGAPQWRLLSPGLPMLLSILLQFVPRSPETIGRWATAMLTGLVPVVPYLLWKGAFRLRTRILAGLILALWPGQILFSGVLAQDNWVIVPVVALTALAVRLVVLGHDGLPIPAALLYVMAVAIREEMLLVLLPIAILASVGSGPGQRLRNAGVAALIIGVLLGGLVLQRGLATGRYALSTEHLGASILGAYVPGAPMVWVNPIPFLETKVPEITRDNVSAADLNWVEIRVAWQEFLRRPAFHTQRIVGSALSSLFDLDSSVISWSLTAPDVLPKEQRKSAIAFKNAIMPVLQIYPFVVQILFATAVFFAHGTTTLSKWIGPILLTALLKVGIHLLIVSQSRYFLVIVALELLTVAIVSEVCFRHEARRKLVYSLLLGVLSVVFLSLIAAKANAYVWAHLESSPLNYSLPPTSGSEPIEIGSDIMRINILDEPSAALPNTVQVCLSSEGLHARIQKLNAQPYGY